MIWNEITGDQIWASPRYRTLLWAFLCQWLWAALFLLPKADFGSAPFLVSAAMLLSPLFYAGIVPPRGHSFWWPYLIGIGFTAALLALLAVMSMLSLQTRAGRAVAALLGW